MREAKNILLLLVLTLGSFAFSQETRQDDSLKMYEGKIVPVYTDAYMKEYYRLKRVILKVYPYALYAADVLDELENNAEAIEKRRKRNKYYKEAYHELKEDFKYVFLDMYQSEGQMLMKLIHRETGMTVYDIAANYRGRKNAEIFSIMGKMWSQDLKVEFHADKEDKIAEHVIRDIENGTIDFKNELKLTTKEEYKEGMETYRENKKVYRKRRKQEEKEKKKEQ